MDVQQYRSVYVGITLKDVVSWAAIICTIGYFSTGISVSRKIMKNKSTSEVSCFPLLTMFCSSTLWLKYGMLTEDSTILIVNGFGSVCGLLYMMVYYSYTQQKGILFRQALFGCAVLFPILTHIRFYTYDKDVAVMHLGLYCSIFGVINAGAPLAALKEVFRTKSTATMSFPLSCVGFLVSIEWYAYGSIIQDLFIEVPNGISVLLGAIQMLLFFKYPSKKSASTFVT